MLRRQHYADEIASLTKQWWRRTTTAMKDKRSYYISRVRASGRQADIEAAVIRATNHDERSIDYKNAARVFSWARTSPTCFSLLLCALTRRATKTSSWVVALKTLLLVHGILAFSPAQCIGRLPFDLSEFCDGSSFPSVSSYGFSAFVRAYFQFLDSYSVLISSIPQFDINAKYSYSKLQNLIPSYSVGADLEILAKMQDLLELLMKIQPYSDGMEVGLILEAMDCVIIEIFEIYNSICRSIVGFFIDAFGSKSSSSSSSSTTTSENTDLTPENWKRLGLTLMRVLRTSIEQNEQLNSYLNICRSLGVLNASNIPPMETISEEDIRDLEDLVHGDSLKFSGKKKLWKKGKDKINSVPSDQRSITVVTMDWEVFEDETSATGAYFVDSNDNPLLCLEDDNQPDLLNSHFSTALSAQASNWSPARILI